MEAQLTWDSVPEDQQQPQEVPQQPQSGSGQYGSGYTNPYDLFDYFFGNRGW